MCAQVSMGHENSQPFRRIGTKTMKRALNQRIKSMENRNSKQISRHTGQPKRIVSERNVNYIEINETNEPNGVEKHSDYSL